MDLEEGNLQDLSGLPGKGPSLWRLWFLHNSTTVMLAKDVLGSLLHTRMKRRDTEGTQKAPEKSRHVMETQQQGPVPGSEDMAHVIPAWRFSTDWPIHPNTERWRPQKQIKSHKNESVGSSAVGRQASPVLYPNRKWGWQGDLSRESLVTPGLENTSPTFNKQQQLSKAGSKAGQHLPPRPPDTQAGVCSTRGTAASWGRAQTEVPEKVTPVHWLKDLISFSAVLSNHNWAGLHSLNEEAFTSSNYR